MAQSPDWNDPHASYRRSVAAQKRWEDPEYRAKTTAGIAAASRRRGNGAGLLEEQARAERRARRERLRNS